MVIQTANVSTKMCRPRGYRDIKGLLRRRKTKTNSSTETAATSFFIYTLWELVLVGSRFRCASSCQVFPEFKVHVYTQVDFGLYEMEGRAMKIVNSHCGTQMERYSKCVERYPNQWYSACSSQRHDLARCSETHPVMMNVKKRCYSVFRNYETCHQSNPKRPYRCSAGFKKFLNCVDLVAEDASK